MNPFEFVLGLIIVISIARIIRFRMGDRSAFEHPMMRMRRYRSGTIDGEPDPEALRLRDEVKQLKDRINVLERITVDKENSLARQIEELRDR